MSERIISLCCVSNRNDKTTELCRIADYVDGCFKPYSFDSRQSFYENERDLLYGPTTVIKGELGAYGIFEWNVLYTGEGQWWTEVDKRTDINWIEVIVLEENSVNAIIKSVKNGLVLPSPYDGRHDLVLCVKAYTGNYDSIFLSSRELSFRDNKLYFDDEVSTVKVGKTNRAAVALGKSRYPAMSMKSFLVSSDAFQLERHYAIKTTAEIVNDVIRSNINRFMSDAFSRKEKKLLRDALSRLTEMSISDMLMERLRCSHEEAQQYIKEFIQTANVKLDDNTTIPFIELLIDNDSDAVLKLQTQVREQWLQEHEQEMNEAKEKLEKIREEGKSIEETNQKNRENLERIQKEEQQARQKVQDAEKLYEEIQGKIQERLQHVREDMAGALIDYSLMGMPAKKESTEQNPQYGYNMRIPNMGEIQKGSVKDGILEAGGYWQQLCSKTRWAESLSLLAAALFAANQPVIITGDGADSVADIMSTTIYGHKPLRIVIIKSDALIDIIHEIEHVNHEVICIENGLGSSYDVVRELMTLFPDSRFILTVKHEEMLSLEPASLFSTFFPVHSDYFYNGNIPNEFPEVDCTAELFDAQLSSVSSRALKEARAKTGKWFGDGYYPPLLRNRFARLQYLLGQINQKVHDDVRIAKRTEIEFLVVPWLRSLRASDHLEELVQDTDVIDTETKEEICAYISTRML